MERKSIRKSAVLTVAALVAAVVPTAMAHPFRIDQASEGNPFGGYGISAETGNTIGQEFTPTFSALDVVEIGLGPRDPSNFGMRVNIRAGGLDGPVVGTSLPAVIQGGPVPVAVFHMDFASPVPLTPGNLYVIQPILDPTSGPVAFPFLDPGPYLGGRAIIHDVTRDDIDMLFRTGLSVPEPATFALLMFSAPALLLSRQRQR
jgi:hypothetical protein